MSQHIVSQGSLLLDDLSGFDTISTQSRKTSPAAGNRSWSEEEETYLLQTRARKMPYKHIAAHLKKTELACRLHYHQLAHGSRRRKRSVSVSSTMSRGSTATISSSGSSPSPPQYRYMGDREAVDVFGCSPLRYDPMPPNNTMAPYTTTGGGPKVLLPKPALANTPPEHSHHFALGTLSTSTAPPTHYGGASADPSRLRGLHGPQRSAFYPAMPAAHDYRFDELPGALDGGAAWHAHGVVPVTYPPTPPDDSPKARSCASIVGALPPPPVVPSQNAFALASSAPGYAVLGYPTASGSMGVPDRLAAGYIPQRASAPQYGCADMGLHAAWMQDAWSQQKPAPTAIASLLTENKCPRGTACSGVNCGHGRH